MYSWSYLFYNLLLSILVLLLMPYYSIVALINPKRAKRFWRRLLVHNEQNSRFAGCILIYAASAGEVRLADKLLGELRRKGVREPVVVSTETHSGEETARRVLGNKVDAVVLLPADLPWLMNSVTRFLSPSVFVVVEANITPNLVRTLRRRNVDIVMINGFLQRRNMLRYRYIPGLLSCVLRYFNAFGVQSRADADILRNYGIDENRIVVTGDMKFSCVKGDDFAPIVNRLQECLTVPARNHVLVFGSTHSGEEKQIFSILPSIWDEFPDVVAIIAPRHLERVSEVLAESRRLGVPTYRTSVLNTEVQGSSILVLDTMGELSSVYSLATVAFVGGTLVPVGGHNLIEPLVYGRPVVFGPYHANVESMAKIVESEGVGFVVNSASELRLVLANLLRDSNLLGGIREKAKRMFSVHTGAVGKSADIVLQSIGRSRVGSR